MAADFSGLFICVGFLAIPVAIAGVSELVSRIKRHNFYYKVATHVITIDFEAFAQALDREVDDINKLRQAVEHPHFPVAPPDPMEVDISVWTPQKKSKRETWGRGEICYD